MPKRQSIIYFWPSYYVIYICINNFNAVKLAKNNYFIILNVIKHISQTTSPKICSTLKNPLRQLKLYTVLYLCNIFKKTILDNINKSPDVLTIRDLNLCCVTCRFLASIKRIKSGIQNI